MSNLIQTYRKETIKELSIIYIKSCIIQELIGIFPTLSQIQLEQNIFKQYIKSMIEVKYFDLLRFSQNIFTVAELKALIEPALDEILNLLSFNNKFSFLEYFPNSFEKYLSEFYISQIAGEFLSKDKYKSNNIYLEYYIRVVDHPQAVSTETWQTQILSRGNNFRGVVNPLLLKNYLTTFLSRNDSKFFDLFSDFRLGVRLIYNPNVTEDKKILFNQLKVKTNIQKEKINGISGEYIDNPNETIYYFPLKICEREYSLFTSIDDTFVSIDRTKQSIINFIDQYLVNIDESTVLTKLTTKLWLDDNFKKMFNYHIPVQIFEILLPRDNLRINELLTEVYLSNLSYNNLYRQIIKLIEKVLSTEDPNKI